MLNDIQKIIPYVGKSGSFHTWTHVANNELILWILINNIGHDNPQPCNHSPGWEDEVPEPPHLPEPLPFQISPSQQSSSPRKNLLFTTINLNNKNITTFE